MGDTWEHGSSKVVLNATSEKTASRDLVNIFAFQKDEGRLLWDWGLYHGSLFGYNSLHIFDHSSGDQDTKVALQKLEKQGSKIRVSNGTFTHKNTELTQWMAEATSDFLVPIDVDEFLVLWKGNTISTEL